MFFCITIYSFEVNTPCSVTASAKHLTNSLSKLLLNHPKLHMRFKLRLYLLQLCTLQCFKKLSLIDVLIPMRADVKKMFSISSSYEGVFFKVRITTFKAKHKWNMSCLVCNFFFQFTIWNLNNAVGILLNLLFNLTIMSCRGLFK